MNAVPRTLILRLRLSPISVLLTRLSCLLMVCSGSLLDLEEWSLPKSILWMTRSPRLSIQLRWVYFVRTRRLLTKLLVPCPFILEAPCCHLSLSATLPMDSVGPVCEGVFFFSGIWRSVVIETDSNWFMVSLFACRFPF